MPPFMERARQIVNGRCPGLIGHIGRGKPLIERLASTQQTVSTALAITRAAWERAPRIIPSLLRL